MSLLIAAQSDTESAEVTKAPLRPVSHFPEIFFAGTILLLVTARLVEAHTVFTRTPGSDWHSSEWMIDYAAGFVRRGLGGAVLRSAILHTGWSFFPLWILFTTVVYLSLCAWLVWFTWHRGGPSTWRFALLFNPILLVAACDHGTLLRKDTLFLWTTLLNVLLSQHLLRKAGANASVRTRHALILLSAAALSSLILALLHEGIFLFVWLPLNLALFAFALSRLHVERNSVALLLSLAFMPSLLAVAASVIRHGDAHTAQTICQSWRFAMPVACTAGSAFLPSVSALGWPLSRAVSLSLGYAASFPAFLAIFALAGAVQIITVRALIPAARLDHLLALLLFPLPACLPLFLLGMDWGRWLCLLAGTSLMLMLSDALRPSVYCCLPSALRRGLTEKLAPILEPPLLSLRRRLQRRPRLLGCILVIFPIPPTAQLWSALVVSPVWIALSLFRHL